MSLVPTKTRMNEKKRLFVEHILRGESGAAAARAAGYAKKTARNTASRLMKDGVVQKELERRRDEIKAETSYTIERAMTELEKAQAMAESKKDASSYARAIELKSKLAGLLIERRQQAEFVKVEIVQFGDVKKDDEATNTETRTENYKPHPSG